MEKIKEDLMTCLLYVFVLSVTLPVSARANDALFITSNETAVPVILGALMGSLAAVFIRTDVDDKLYKPALAKLVIGFSLGIVSPITWEAFDSAMIANRLALPAFCIALFGTPICCFLISFVCDPNSWKLILNIVLKRFGINVEPKQSRRQSDGEQGDNS